MNKILRAAATAACLVMALHSWGWGQKGHDVTANIAERHLGYNVEFMDAEKEQRARNFGRRLLREL